MNRTQKSPAVIGNVKTKCFARLPGDIHPHDYEKSQDVQRQRLVVVELNTPGYTLPREVMIGDEYVTVQHLHRLNQLVWQIYDQEWTDYIATTTFAIQNLINGRQEAQKAAYDMYHALLKLQDRHDLPDYFDVDWDDLLYQYEDYVNRPESTVH